jgi:hypothetical protein
MEDLNAIIDMMCGLLWVDSVCIDQAYLTERAAQVSLMGRIFKSAKMVFAWTGKADRLFGARLSFNLDDTGL